MTVTETSTGIQEGEQPVDNNFSEKQYLEEEKSDLITEFAKRRVLIAKHEHKPNPKDVEWSRAVGDVIINYMEAIGRGERIGACFLRKYNGRGALENEKQYLTHLDKDYTLPKEIFDRIEQSTGCQNLRKLLETDEPDILRAEIGYLIHQEARKQNIDPSDIKTEDMESKLSKELNALLGGFRYQQCGRQCKNRNTCERKKRDIDNYMEYAEQSKDVKDYAKPIKE